MLSLVLFVCVLCSVYVWGKYNRGQSSAHALPPALPGELPVFGHALTVFKYYKDLYSLLKYVADNCAKQGGVIYSKFGTELCYTIVDQQDSLTAANSCLQRHYLLEFIKPFVGNSLMTSYGETWKRHRKLLNPAFTLPVIHSFVGVFNNQSRKLIKAMESYAGKGIFDHRHLLKTNALETLCLSSFGVKAIDDVKLAHKYMDSLEEIILIGKKRVIQFWLRNDLIYWLVGLKKKEDEIVNTLHSMVNKVLQEKKAVIEEKAKSNNTETEATGTNYKSFLDLVLELSKNGALTDAEVRDEMNSITAAGFETTSNQLTFVLIQLGAHPDVQEKLYEELIEVLGPERDVEKDDVNKLVYTNAVLMESLRLLPSVPLLLRNVDKDVKLKNYTMRAGSNCLIFPLANEHDPSWGPESKMFRPERWLNGDIKSNTEFAGFGLGKRGCIGRTFAMITMKVTLAHIIRRFRIKADLTKLKLGGDFVLKPIAGFEISIELRK